jgi:DNA-binding NarL/FixJ family response regulator
MGGITAIKKLRASSITSKILVFSALGEEDKVFEALQAGADSYVWKEEGLGGIADAVVATSQGRAVCSPTIARQLDRRLDFLLRRLHGISLEEALRVKEKEAASASSESSLGR